jgi:hypothetical protein
MRSKDASSSPICARNRPTSATIASPRAYQWKWGAALARVLEYPRAGDLAGHESPGFGHHLVERVGVDQNEGGDLDRGQYTTDIRLEVAAELRREAAWRGGGSGVAAEPLALGSVRGVPPVRRAPRVSDRLDLLLPARERRHPRSLVGREVGHLRVDEDQRPRPLRVGSREERGHDRGFVGRQDRCALRSGRFHDREDVVGEGVDVGDVARREPLGAAPTPAVGDDESRVPGQAPKEAGEVRALPVHVDVRAVTLEVDEVGRAISADLVGERHVAVPGEPGLRPLHADIVVLRLPLCNSAHGRRTLVVMQVRAT